MTIFRSPKAQIEIKLQASLNRTLELEQLKVFISK